MCGWSDDIGRPHCLQWVTVPLDTPFTPTPGRQYVVAIDYLTYYTKTERYPWPKQVRRAHTSCTFARHVDISVTSPVGLPILSRTRSCSSGVADGNFLPTLSVMCDVTVCSHLRWESEEEEGGGGGSDRLREEREGPEF